MGHECITIIIIIIMNHKGHEQSRTNVSKLTIYLPTFNGNKLAHKSNKCFISKSVSGLKKYSPLNFHNQSKFSSVNSIRINSPKIKSKITKTIDIKPMNKSSTVTPMVLSCKNQDEEKHNKNKYFKSGSKLKNQEIRKILNKMNKEPKKQNPTTRFNIKPFKKVAAGQYGGIYLGYSLELRMIFALKSFKKNKINLQFMIDEFKIQLYCKHPHILPAYGFYVGQQQCFLIMEAGMSNLYTKLKKQGCFSEETTARYLFQIMKGISYLHLNGVIHRDLKPQNIIVCGGDTLKITDFGWSVISDSERTTFCGTIDYVSPEVSTGRFYNNKIDCWSIGILAFQMMLGYPPFPVKKSDGEHPLLNYDEKVILPSELSLGCKNFIMKMLKKDPRERPTINEAMYDDWIQKYAKLERAKIEKDRKLEGALFN